MKKKSFILTSFGMVALLSCGGGNQPPAPTGDFTITLESQTLTISSTTLTEGQDFNAVVRMNEGVASKCDMPVTLGNIQVEGGEDIKYTDYTYEINPDLESANVVIPGKFITNNLKIIAEAKTVQHKLVFSKSDAFRAVKSTVGKNESLDTDINIKDYWKGYVTIPDTLTISIGERELGRDEFDYKVIKVGFRAHLKIDAKLITDDIIVTSKVTPADYEVEIKDKTSSHLEINHDEATVATDFNTTLSVTEPTYLLPTADEIEITCKDAQSGKTYEIPKVKGYYYSPKSGALTIYHQFVYGDITIDAVAQKAQFILEVESSTDETELEFYKDSTYTNKITEPIAIIDAPLEEGYSIYVKTKDTSGTAVPDYIVPSTFDITVDGEKVYGYDVYYGGIPSPIAGDKHYATLKIQKDCVKGHVHVYGVGQEESKHALKVNAIYLNTSDLPEYITEPQEITCILTPKDGHNYPLAENVNVKIAEVWYDGNGYSDDGDKINISYNSSNGTLVIGKTAVEKADEKEGSDIEIIAKPADVSILKELTSGPYKEWETLHALSMYGYKLFTPGETTGDFYLEGIDYPFQARLIGFKQERGATDTGYVQGLTLEFTTSITQKQYYKVGGESNTYYKKKTGGIFESNLYKVLNDRSDGIINLLPSGLKDNLYEVTKYGLSEDGNTTHHSVNYLFPLSLSEMNEKIITTDLDAKYDNESANPSDLVYDYYKQFKTKDELRKARIKGYANKSSDSYWLRTPEISADLDKQNKDYYIFGLSTLPDSQGLARTDSQTNKGVAPAFCI